jgi:quercetin dioxygenase-like cupin family protein
VLITDDGKETRLTRPGDTIVQRGTVHGWKNPGPGWTRFVSILVDAEPAVVDGEPLPESADW